MLQSDSENTTSVKVGEQSIGGLAMNGGTIIFDTDIPAATLAEGYISVDTLVVGAGDYTWKGRNYQVNGRATCLSTCLNRGMIPWRITSDDAQFAGTRR
ncbi:Outer membrane autotransporter barrel domain protein precursor [Escherichia coli]|uniref:Outer membrane autotransporter barrel domain protein n=1 Tax=Escherichia coli TaxID=562 RepID=A0A2X1NC30_ECOLX|nr:Outer membrane autotransporter barrel domain protein precursor [Escherichia coli]